ncbi:hypothetical protein ABIC03_003449 [Bradyrhizobium sp. RT6a]|uniref:hypothetical protein n=1 Tax=unclassified Bradyrhizobium TaxID=2631580 RepID=UPI003399C35B
MSRENDARVSGEKIGKDCFDAFEATNKSPTRDELAALRERWAAHLAAQHRPYGEGHPLSDLMLEAANYHVEGRIKFHEKHRSTGGQSSYGRGDTWYEGRPKAHPERGWSAPFGIAKHDSRSSDD